MTRIEVVFLDFISAINVLKTDKKDKIIVIELKSSLFKMKRC